MFAKKSTVLLVMFVAVIILLFRNTDSARAAPIDGFPVTVTQPDGTQLNLFVSGDEFYNWLKDDQGYTIIQDPNTGYYVYADLVKGELVPTSFVVGQTDPASVGLKPYLNISPEKMETIRQAAFIQMEEAGMEVTNAPTTGTINNLVIFIRFSDEGEFTNPTSLYTNMLNSSTAGADSLRNYYREVSYNALTINSSLYPTPGTTIISYQNGHPRAYYQPYNAVTNPIGYTDDRGLREHTLLRDAINYVKGLGQFPSGDSIDGDGDGYVDSMTFVVSGSPDGWSELLWPHMWSLFTYTVTINGKTVGEYSFHLNDWLQTGGTGVLAHEMFHVLGAPDLYHYVGNGIQPVGGWDVMEANATPPQHMGCYMKFKYGHWISNIPELTATGTYSLNPLTSSTNNCRKIASPYSATEFFVLEYRNATGSTFESSLPGNGLLVYRINTLATGNASGPPDEVYVYRPGGTLSENGEVNLANFSSNVGRTAINDSTDPSSFLSDGSSGGLNLCNVGGADATISFDLCSIVDPFLFADDFESGNLSKWSSTVTDAGDLSVSGAAAWQGNYGMQAVIDDNVAIYATSDHPEAESRYRASFFFDPNSISMINGDTHMIFGGYSGTSTLVLRLQFRRSSGLYQVQAGLLNDGSTWSTSAWITIDDAYHQMEFDWRAARVTGANNGALTFWVDGVQQADLTGVDNDTRRIDYAQLGAVGGIDTGTRGTYYFDEFQSSRGGLGTATLTVTKTGTGSGTVTSDPPGINCGSTCAHSFDTNTEVVLTATEDPGSTFVGWSGGGCFGAGTCTVTMTAATSVNAEFTSSTSLPDLVPYPVIVSSVPGTSTNNTLYAGRPTYFDWYFTNSGTGTAFGSFHVELWVGQTRYVRYPFSDFEPGWTSGFDDWQETIPEPGWHTVMLITDPDNTISESDETNNIWQSEFYWEPETTDIFHDDFESGNLSQWTPCVIDGGDLSVTSAAALQGNYGMRALLDDNVAIYCQDDSPTAEPRYVASFLFDPNSLSMVNGDTHTIFGGYSGTSTLVLRLQFRRSSNLYQVQAGLLNDGSTWRTSTWTTITDAPHQFKLDWRAATGVGTNDGTLTFWVDGLQKAVLTGVDNDTRRIDRARLGAVAGIDAGTRGTYYFDEFQSSRGDTGPTFTLTVTKTGTGSGKVTSDPPGIDCGSACSATFSSGIPVILYAFPDPGSTFTGWGGEEDCLDGQVTMNASKTCIANFDQIPGNVSVVGAFTADGNWNPKATFAPGDPIQWVLEVQNDTGQDAEIELTYDVRGPNGESVAYWSGIVTTGPGVLLWGLPGTVEGGLVGTHTLYGSGLYQGQLSQASSTYTVSSDGLIFADSFENVDCASSPWTTCVLDGGNLSFGPPPLVSPGNQSLRALLNDNHVLHVGDNRPNAEPRYHARFYFDPNSIGMVNGDLHRIFYGYSGTSKVVLRVEFRRYSNNYQIRAGLLTDASSWKNTAWFTITDALHSIELDWRAATAAGANNGGLTVWIDGTQKANLIAVDNDTWRIDLIYLGGVNGIDTGTRGTYYFDAFVSRRDSYIGPASNLEALSSEIRPVSTDPITTP